MSLNKSAKNIILILALVFAFGFSIVVHADEPVDDNDYSNEVVPGYE